MAEALSVRRALVPLALLTLILAGPATAGTPSPEWTGLGAHWARLEFRGTQGRMGEVPVVHKARPTPAPDHPARAAVVGARQTVVSGIASWGPFDGHVVTRLPRGTRISVCGDLGCWSGESYGYGPASYTGRIADLDRSVFASICGDPSMGLCHVTLRY